MKKGRLQAAFFDCGQNPVCHPERSEGSGFLARSTKIQIPPRFTPRNDKRLAVSSSCDLFRHRLRLREQIQIIRPSGLRVGTGHIKPAKGMRADHRAGALAIDI